MSNNGYVKIHRSLMKKGYYLKSEYVHLWLHLIFKATYTEKEYLFNGKIEYLKPGQFITGRKSLVKETGINRSKVERILKFFENEHQIEQQTNNRFRIISILNWEQYQKNEQPNEQPVSNQRATSEQPVSTINKDKKEKKVKKEIIYPTLEEAKSFFKENGYKESSAETAWRYYSEADWHNRDGKKVLNWKQTMRGVWFRDENKVADQRPEAPKKTLEELIS